MSNIIPGSDHQQLTLKACEEMRFQNDGDAPLQIIVTTQCGTVVESKLPPGAWACLRAGASQCVSGPQNSGAAPVAKTTQGLRTAVSVLRQLITLSSAIVAGDLALFWAHRSPSVSNWWLYGSAIAGGVCVFVSLLFLTDMAAVALGSKEHTLPVRYCLFIMAWVLFLLCAVGTVVYVIKLIPI